MSLDIKKLNPWNWFKREEENESHRIPVVRCGDQNLNYTSFPNQLFSLHQEIDRIFDNVFRNFGFPSRALSSNLSGLENALLRPNIDIDSTDNEYRITIEVPGINERDIKLELEPDNTLIIRGNKEQESEEKGRDYYWSERSYGSFERLISLPHDADTGNISANFKDGVLTVAVKRKALPKPETRQIDINRDTNNTR